MIGSKDSTVSPVAVRDVANALIVLYSSPDKIFWALLTAKDNMTIIIKSVISLENIISKPAYAGDHHIPAFHSKLLPLPMPKLPL
jgi:hypothetical protein